MVGYALLTFSVSRDAWRKWGEFTKLLVLEPERSLRLWQLYLVTLKPRCRENVNNSIMLLTGRFVFVNISDFAEVSLWCAAVGT
jgi:hypothetical protein